MRPNHQNFNLSYLEIYEWPGPETGINREQAELAFDWYRMRVVRAKWKNLLQNFIFYFLFLFSAFHRILLKIYKNLIKIHKNQLESHKNRPQVDI